MSDQATGQRIEQALLLVASELDEQRKHGAANQVAIMAKLDAILSQMMPMARRLEIAEANIESLQGVESRPTNGKGAH
jgi:hypothetical protein